MNDSFQIVPGEFVVRRSVRRPCCPKDRRSICPAASNTSFAKTSPNGLLHRVERQDLVPDLVSVDQNHVGITRRHPAGHRTLSRTDPPDNSENGNVRVI